MQGQYRGQAPRWLYLICVHADAETSQATQVAPGANMHGHNGRGWQKVFTNVERAVQVQHTCTANL